MRLINPSYTRASREKTRFLASLATDLGSVGVRAEVARRGRKIGLTAELPDVPGTGVHRMMKLLRDRQLRSASAFIARMEKANVLDLFASGCDLNIDTISPRIHFCRTRKDLELYRYCSLLQTVPGVSRVGRQIRALIYDDGQYRPVLMGAIGLASSTYTIACRDQYLGWTENATKSVKDAGLRRIMDVAVCISFLPYSLLLGGKLVALLSATDPLRDEFRRKYGGPLLGLITTCATGIHCPIFNRIMVREGGLYRRIGETAGYSTLCFSRDTVRGARRLIAHSAKGDTRQPSPAARPLHVLRRAMRLCGIPDEAVLRLGNPKGVYFAALSDGTLPCLRTGRSGSASDGLSTKDGFEYWRDNILPKRRNRQAVVEKVVGFRPQEMALSRYVG